MIKRLSKPAFIFYAGGADTLHDVKKVLKKTHCKTGDDVFVYAKDHEGRYSGYDCFGIVKVEHYGDGGSYKDVYVNADNLKYGRGCFSDDKVKKLLR